MQVFTRDDTEHGKEYVLKSEADALCDEVRLLKLAEEGAAEAFGVVVQDKRDLEAEVRRLQSLLDGAYASIREYAKAKQEGAAP